jgi:hypothetical protein
VCVCVCVCVGERAVCNALCRPIVATTTWTDHDARCCEPTTVVLAVRRANPDRAGLIETARDLERVSMKELKKQQEEEAARMLNADADALSADRQRVLAAAKVSMIPQFPPTVDVFPRAADNDVAAAASAAKALASKAAPVAAVAGATRESALFDVLKDVHAKLQKDVSDVHAAAFLRSGVIEAASTRVQLSPSVAEWLLTLITVHPDSLVVRACGEALLRSFVEEDRGASSGEKWTLTAHRVITALCGLGATEATLGRSDAMNVSEGVAPAAAGAGNDGGVTFPLHNLQKVVEVVERATHAGAVSEADACELLPVLFRLTADRRTAAITFNMERAVTGEWHELQLCV